MESFQIGRMTKLDRCYNYSTVEYDSNNNKHTNDKSNTKQDTKKIIVNIIVIMTIIIH